MHHRNSVGITGGMKGARGIEVKLVQPFEVVPFSLRGGRTQPAAIIFASI